jgi:post-segregation antitoxin (ccd killing protein)
MKDLPAGVEEAINRALAQDPAKRWRKPSEFLAALEASASKKGA